MRMSLGLPSHLARPANARALASAATWAGLVCLGAAVVNVIVASLRSAGSSSWVTLVALMPMVALLILLARHRTVVLTIVYLVVGALCTYIYVLTILTGTPAYLDTNLFVVALPVVAMTLGGGTGSGSLPGILWATCGFALAECAVFLAATTVGREYRQDAISLGAYLLMVGVLVFDGLNRGTRSRTQSRIHRSFRDARLIELRRELLGDSAAELHDTVLSELLAVASAEPGPLSGRLRDRIEADLRTVGGGMVGADTAGTGADTAGTAGGEDSPVLSAAAPTDVWFASELHQAIELARDEGLAVDVSGDRDALARLDPACREALGLAVRQCLVNVLRHSGSATAEVAIAASGDTVSVMVVDAGRGFVPSDTAADRLGLRHSVHDRIERVGGTTTVYSSADVGTSVLLVVPTARATGAPGESGEQR